MSFTSSTFLFLFAALCTLYYLVPKRFQNALLLLASYGFYMWAGPQYGLVLLLTTAVTYGGTLWMDRQHNQARRKAVLGGLAVADLGVLVAFKYFNFFADLLTSAGVAIPRLSLVMTAGLSFYTFQLVGYCIDVYRREVPAERNAIDFALFISFFPQILSGPIGRAGELLPQYKRARTVEYDNLRDGTLRFLLGAFKKLVVADGLARYVDATYANLHNSGGLTVAITIVLYALQIYFDFSGYTDMALGVAQCMGIKLRENFFVPYAGATLGEFWTRWHMSLSTWFRDYLYISLGGNRRGFARKLLNTLLVFVVSGLWHGAALTFVVWGLWHGVFRLIEEIVLKLRGQKKPSFRSKFARFCGIVVTDCIVFLGWVWFRADYLWNFPIMLRNLFRWEPLSVTVNWLYGVMQTAVASSAGYAKFTFALFAGAVLLALVLDWVMLRSAARGQRQYNPLLCMNVWMRTAVCMAMVICILVIGVFGGSGFIYYNF